MARKKADNPPPATSAPGPRRTVLTIKGTDAWKEWLEEGVDHLRMPASTIVDHALIRYFKEMGFKKEAPKR